MDRTNGVAVPGVIQRTNILSWQWDFNGDGVVEDSSDVSTNLDATWYAVFDALHAVNGMGTFTPRLTVTYTNPISGGVFTTTQTNITTAQPVAARPPSSSIPAWPTAPLPRRAGS